MTQDLPKLETWISSIEVKGLHNRLDFELSLKQGINIVYGKNGIGKTTLLHIIANLSEVDIDRFHNLSFKKITITNNDDKNVQLEKIDGLISVHINGQRTSYESGKVELSDLERNSVRSVVGDRATYLPAFRSVLERMRESSYTYEERSKPEFEAALQAEMQALRLLRYTGRRQGNIVDSNVSKTLRCRQWFGSFVPVIRYPSIIDVISGLSDEWTSAQIGISRAEQRQFETVFVEIFSAIAKGNTSNKQQDQQKILDEIRELVSFDEVKTNAPTRTSAYLQLVAIAEQTYRSDRNYNNILEIYRDKLRDRKVEREVVLTPINAFQESVNVFLSEKSFRVGSHPSVSSSRIRESSVFIESDMGRVYGIDGLSSGERQIITILYSASRSPFRDGCCLIDEPELSLHVDWQRIILKHIEKQSQGRQIIACTHSPEVGADHEGRVKFFAPRSVAVFSDEIETDETVGL